MYSAILQH